MLRQLRIHQLGVIDDAVLELSPGLNVLTGETGAGKTMVVTGLGLLLGARGDAGLVRAGARSAGVEGVVELAPGHPALARAEQAGADIDEPVGETVELILSRSVSEQGRSRAHVGGRIAPVGVLGELGELLVAVHGQADQWRLRRPDQHRELLDRYAGAAVHVPLADLQERYDEHVALHAELERLRGLERDRTREADVLRAGLEDLESVDPQPGEDDDLRAEDDRLAHADGLRAAAGSARDLLAGSDDDLAGRSGAPAEGALATVAAARTALSPMTGHDAALADLERRLGELGYLLADVSGDLAGYLGDVEVDPLRLAAVQARRAELARVKRAYGDTLEDVLAWGKQAAARLDELEGAKDRAAEVSVALDEASAELTGLAARVTAGRTEAAGRLAGSVTSELGRLAMGSAAVQVRVAPRTNADGGAHLNRTGADDVEILLAANSGAPPRNVAAAASGGELSRVMLALEVATGGGGDVPTFVFDEVDAGVGGRAALDVGARLAALAEHAQVVVVTHLAQVAAYADRHLVVHKADDGQVTVSGVTEVTGNARLAELARMMSGSADTSAAVEHARELLETASRVGGTRGSRARDSRGSEGRDSPGRDSPAPRRRPQEARR